MLSALIRDTAFRFLEAAAQTSSTSWANTNTSASNLLCGNLYKEDPALRRPLGPGIAANPQAAPARARVVIGGPAEKEPPMRGLGPRKPEPEKKSYEQEWPSLGGESGVRFHFGQ